MSFFPHYAFFLFSAPSKWNVLCRITEIRAHKLRLHAPFTMDIIKGRLLSDAFSDVFMSCICFADTVNICGNKHIFIVIVIVKNAELSYADASILAVAVICHLVAPYGVDMPWLYQLTCYTQQKGALVTESVI